MDGQLPTDEADAADLALEAALKLRGLGTQFNFRWAAWAVLDHNENTVFEGGPVVPVEGSHEGTGANGSPSRILTFFGRAWPDNLQLKGGHTRVMVYTDSAYPLVMGGHKLPIGWHDDWASFGEWLHGHDRIFADRYGQKCRLESYVTFGSHAHLQNFRGA